MVSEIKVLVVEPLQVLRWGLGAMAASIPEVGRWHGTASLAEALDAVAELPPIDVVIASASVVVAEGRAAVFGAVPTAVLVPTAEPRDLEVATTIDANGYIVVPDITPASLRTALVELVEGRMSLPPPVATHLLKRARGDDAVVVPGVVRLSPREEEVVELLVGGLSNRQIAHELGISIHGAKRHVSSVLNKLNSPTRAHLVSRVLRSGMVRTG